MDEEDKKSDPQDPARRRSFKALVAGAAVAALPNSGSAEENAAATPMNQAAHEAALASVIARYPSVPNIAEMIAAYNEELGRKVSSQDAINPKDGNGEKANAPRNMFIAETVAGGLGYLTGRLQAATKAEQQLARIEGDAPGIVR